MEKRVSPKWSLGGRVRKVSSLSLSVEVASLCERVGFGSKSQGLANPARLRRVKNTRSFCQPLIPGTRRWKEIIDSHKLSFDSHTYPVTIQPVKK